MSDAPAPLQTLETRLERIEEMVNHILDRLDTLSAGWGKRLNDVRLRYDRMQNQLDARVGALEEKNRP